MQKKIINLGSGELIVGSALRHATRLLEPGTLAYDTGRPAACNDILLCEIARLPAVRFHYESHIGIESVRRENGGLVFSAHEIREGLVAITAGNRYAPRSITGGLDNPVTGAPNGEIRGGSLIDDLMDMNIAGFVNYSAAGEERAKLRVLGVLLNADGSPMKLPARPARETASHTAATRHVLIAGSAMESGKTTCCMALAAGLAARGFTVTYEKKTGTSSVRDMMRVALGRYDLLKTPGSETRTRDARIPVADFTDTIGTISDVSLPADAFVNRSLETGDRWTDEHRPAFHLIELADNLTHVSNLALLTDKRFRDRIRDLVYVPDPSFDAAYHAVHHIGSLPGWRELNLAFSGAVAADAGHLALRTEIEDRLDVPCIAARTADGTIDGTALANWLLAHGAET